MNFLKKGPEIKLPKLRGREPSASGAGPKVPDAVLDVYYELKERHLLPLVAVLVVAIVAVPIALSEGGGDDAEGEGAGAVAGISATPAADKSRVVVAKTLPGLRDYQKRLEHQTERNPFEEPGEAQEAEQVIGEVEDAIDDVIDDAEDGGTGESAPGSITRTFTYYSWLIDVRVVPVSTNGKPSKEKPSIRKDLPELSMLPGRDTPAVVFMGPTKDGKKALMLVSSNVKAIFGDAICVVGGESCQMLALEEGVPETFVYGGNERIFRIELRDIRLVPTEKRTTAPLGKPGDSAPNAGLDADAYAAE